jgi:hypothetical protein
MPASRPSPSESRGSGKQENGKKKGTARIAQAMRPIPLLQREGEVRLKASPQFRDLEIDQPPIG